MRRNLEQTERSRYANTEPSYQRVDERAGIPAFEGAGGACRYGDRPVYPQHCFRRPTPPTPATYSALLRELSAIGNNVNQIAYWANAQQSASEADIQEAAALIRRAWRLVKETL